VFGETPEKNSFLVHAMLCLLYTKQIFVLQETMTKVDEIHKSQVSN
jgi:hypothetical protein